MHGLGRRVQHFGDAHETIGVETVGEVIEISPPEHIVFTYGYATGNPIPPGASRVTVRLAPDAAGTRLRLLHEFEDPAVRDQHVQGWRYQLSLFANAVADEVFADAATLVDAWFEAWTNVDPDSRDETLTRIAAPGIVFRNRFSLLEGIDDLKAHVAAAQRFMPGMRLQRAGDVRQCQGAVLADWVARGVNWLSMGGDLSLMLRAAAQAIRHVRELERSARAS